MFTFKASNLSSCHWAAAACEQWYYGPLFHRREYCNADCCNCLKISPWLTILFFFLFLHSSLIVKWGLHLTTTIMSFLVCYAAFKHNCLKKIYRGLFKLKFLISTKTKKHDLNILFPLTFHKLKMILVMNLLNKIRIKVEKKQNLGI